MAVSCLCTTLGRLLRMREVFCLGLFALVLTPAHSCRGEDVFRGLYVLKGELEVAALTTDQKKALKQSKVPPGNLKFNVVKPGQRIPYGQFMRSGKSGVRFLLDGHTVVEACQASEFGIATVPMKDSSRASRAPQKAALIYVFSGRVGLITHPKYLPPNQWVAITDGKKGFKTQGGLKILSVASYEE